jgi:hypothetical protein
MAKVQVWAAAAGALVRVAAWDPASLGEWPESVREAVVFARGALMELEQHGADVSARDEVEVVRAAGAVPAGFPSLPARVNAGA